MTPPILRRIPKAGNWEAIDIYHKTPIERLEMRMGRFVVSFTDNTRVDEWTSGVVAAAVYTPDSPCTQEDLDFINSLVAMTVDQLGEMT